MRVFRNIYNHRVTSQRLAGMALGEMRPGYLAPPWPAEDLLSRMLNFCL